MLKFNPADPFPILASGAYTYAQAQEHAAGADQWLGLRVEETERELIERGCRRRATSSSRDRQELWIGLAAKSLMTPYLEIRRLLERLAPQPGAVIADLGAAYARMGFVIGRHYQQLQFTGYEYVGERVAEARRCLARHAYKNVRMVHADLSCRDFRPEPADIYFIYDYGTPQAIEKTLYDLRRQASVRPITVVARGKACHLAIETRHGQWLRLEAAAELEGKSSVFRSGRAQSLAPGLELEIIA